jgi:pimeloyl-ACP methyl ester carboxylesterase
VFGRFNFAGEPGFRHPTAILLHGWNADVCYQRLFPYLARRLGRAGLNTAMIELPYHMQRRPPSGPVRDFISSDLSGMLSATRQAIADTRALVHWLAGQGAPLIGLWGFSLGAWLAGLLAEVEPRLGFAVLTTPIARVDRVIAELPFCEPIRCGLGGRQVDLSGLNLASHRPRVGSGGILLVESQYDQFAPAETVEELWQAWDKPEIWRASHGHISVLMSVAIMGRTVRWIRERSNSCLSLTGSLSAF